MLKTAVYARALLHYECGFQWIRGSYWVDRHFDDLQFPLPSQSIEYFGRKQKTTVPLHCVCDVCAPSFGHLNVSVRSCVWGCSASKLILAPSVTEISAILRDTVWIKQTSVARLLVPLAPAECTHAGRCFLRLMTLSNGSSEINEREVMTDWRKISTEQEPGLICAYTTNSRQVAYCAPHIRWCYCLFIYYKKILFRMRIKQHTVQISTNLC